MRGRLTEHVAPPLQMQTVRLQQSDHSRPSVLPYWLALWSSEKMADLSDHLRPSVLLRLALWSSKTMADALGVTVYCFDLKLVWRSLT